MEKEQGYIMIQILYCLIINYLLCSGRADCVMKKHFLEFLAGGDPERGSVGGVLPEFLQHAVCPATAQESV